MQFSGIIGQEKLKSHVQNALRTGHVSHAYLFSGEEGAGKKMLARTFAQVLLCENRQEKDGIIEPCESCPGCVMAKSATHPDLRILTHEKLGFVVGEIRDQLVHDIGLSPMRAEHRIYIIPEADKMNTAAQNALLKTLEEPPSYAVILLITARPEALLQTILSRTIELPLRPVRDDQIIRYLMQQERVPDYRAKECAAFAEGNVGRALSYAADDRFRDRLEQTTSLLKELDDLATAQIMERLHRIFFPPREDDKQTAKKKLKDAGIPELMDFLDLLTILIRDAMVWKATGARDKLVFAAQEAYDEKAAAQSWQQLKKNLDFIREARERLNANVSADLTMELLFLGMTGV